MIPEGNNVCGIVVAPNDLQSLFRAVRAVIPPPGRVYIRVSGFNGTETLHVRSEWAEFDSEDLEEDGRHLFNGAVGGSLDEIVDFVQKLSESLSSEGVEHSLEVYGENRRLLREFSA